MRNQITLSLITVAILGLNGCGGTEKSTTSDSSIKLSSIQKLSNASDKHTEKEWLEIEYSTNNLDDTEGFNTMLLGSIEKNVASLTKVGIDKEMSYAMNSDVMFDDLTQLDIEDLDNQVVAECKDDDTCKEEAYASINVELEIDKEEAYAMAEDFRADRGKPTTMDGLLKEFTCDAGLVRKVQFYGVEDNFSTANGDENATASQQVQSNPGIMAYNNGIGLSNYDTTQVNRQFAEEIRNLPSNITKGMFYIGFENHGSNDGMTLGNIDTDTSTLDYFSENVLGLGWNQSGQVHYTDLGSIMMEDGNSLESYANANQKFDVYIQDDTYVDFITVATCSKPDPIKEVTTIVNKFECSEKETLVKILGGEIDAFALTTDANPVNPTTDLNTSRDANTVYPNVVVDYDYTAYDHHFIDTLRLNLSSSQTVTKSQLNIGYKVIGSSLYGNDAIYVGDFGTNHAGGHLYDNTAPIAPQGWNVTNVGGYGDVAEVNLSALLNNSGLATGDVQSTMIAQNKLDIYVQDDTAVDFTQLNLCVKDNCDEGAEDISLDLSQLASWTTQATDAENNSNPIPSVWDDSLNWIEFTSKEANGDRVLEIPFCACSNAIIDIKSLKADNLATVKIDNNTTIVTQNASGQASMRADNNGGVHASGSHTITNTTSGPTNHTLRVDVHNQSAWFGVGIEGTLNFKGNLGECK